MKDKWWDKYFDFEVEIFLRYTIAIWIMYTVLGFVIVSFIMTALWAMEIVK